jgi:putative redox protein
LSVITDPFEGQEALDPAGTFGGLPGKVRRAPTQARLLWEGGERFRGDVGGKPVVLDGSSDTEISPMQAVAIGLAGCMSIDVASILEKGRQPVAGIEVRLVADRAEGPPRRFEAIRLHFRVVGEVPLDRIERAIALSRQKYCSVWHSLRQEMAFDTSFEVVEKL